MSENTTRRSLVGSYLYQNAHASPEEIKAGFSVRKHEYNVIKYDLLRNWDQGSVQHYLLVGRRGSGKSTLLRRIQVEIDTNEDLTGYFAVNPAEEQANIFRLSDLLEEIIREMELRRVEVERPEQEDDGYQYSKELFRGIHKALENSKKKLVLLLDNLDRIFENINDDLSMLREHLQNFGDIKIIGASTRVSEHFWAYDQPFYEFFRVMHLKALRRTEIEDLFLHWAEKQGLPQLKDFIENRPGQLDAIRILTDGLPRMIQAFVQIVISENPDSGYEYLWALMDEMTSPYQERLNSLPAAQRKIVLQLAFFWESVGTKELAEAIRMETKLISALLSQLVEKQVVDKIETDNKNHLYRLSERFFNLWLIFTQGNADVRRRAKYLTLFLEIFYDRKGLIEVASTHLQAMKLGKVAAGKAAMLTKALARVKAINAGTRDELIKETLKIEGLTEEMRREIPPTTLEVYKQVEKFMALKNWKMAFRQVEDIEQEDGTREFATGIIYKEMGDASNEEAYYIKAAELGLRNAMHDLLVIYLRQKRIEDAEKMFWKAYERRLPMEPESLMAMRRVFGSPDIKWEDGGYPFTFEFDLGLVAIVIGSHYENRQQFDLTEKYFQLAINLGNEQGLYNLGLHYYRRNVERKKSIELMKEYFYINEHAGEREYSAYVGLKIWAGDFNGIDDLIQYVIRKDEFVQTMLESLLFHNQLSTVKKLFASPISGSGLKEKYLPLYYAMTLLTSKDVRTERKIPPELKETVDAILEWVQQKRKFYYPNEAE